MSGPTRFVCGFVGALFHLANVARDLGWFGVALVAFSPFAFRAAAYRIHGMALGLAVLAMGVPIALARIEADRYVVAPLVLLAVIAGAAFGAGLRALASSRPRAWRLAASALVLGQPMLAAVRVAA